MTNAAKFGRLLTEAIWRIRGLEDKSIEVIQDELGYALGKKGGASIERWRQGHQPAKLPELEELANALRNRTDFDCSWFEQFLQAGGHPYPKQFCYGLFPPTAEPPPLATIVHLKPEVRVKRAGADYLTPAQFAMPVYNGDIIYAHSNAQAVIICQNGLVLEVPAENNLVITCRLPPTDKRVRGRLDAVLGQYLLQFSNPTRSSDIELTAPVQAELLIQAINLEQTGLIYLLAQLDRGQGRPQKAVTRLEWLINTGRVTSTYLWLQLGDIFLETGNYNLARVRFQTALNIAINNNDKETIAAAYMRLSHNDRAAHPSIQLQQKLMAYVRSLAQEITAATAPHLINDFQEFADFFITKMTELGSSFKPGQLQTLTFGAGDEPDKLWWILTTTYFATLQITKTMPVSEIESISRSGQLAELLRYRVETIASQELHLPESQAQSLAASYAQLTVERLQELVQLSNLMLPPNYKPPAP